MKKNILSVVLSSIMLVSVNSEYLLMHKINSGIKFASENYIINTPTIQSPTSTVDSSYVFNSSVFSSNNAPSHTQSVWDLSLDNSFTNIVNTITTSTNLTSLSFNNLNEGTVYYLRVKYLSGTSSSEYSPYVTFTSKINMDNATHSWSYSSDGTFTSGGTLYYRWRVSWCEVNFSTPINLGSSLLMKVNRSSWSTGTDRYAVYDNNGVIVSTTKTVPNNTPISKLRIYYTSTGHTIFSDKNIAGTAENVKNSGKSCIYF